MRRTNPLITLHRKKISEGVLNESRLVREDRSFMFKRRIYPILPVFSF
jgi:hypothetical protein